MTDTDKRTAAYELAHYQAERELAKLPLRVRLRIYLGGAAACERWIEWRTAHILARKIDSAMRDNAAKSWDDAPPDEIRDARIQSLEEGLEHLKWCVLEALHHGGSLQHAAVILDEEWSK